MSQFPFDYYITALGLVVLFVIIIRDYQYIFAHRNYRFSKKIKINTLLKYLLYFGEFNISSKFSIMYFFIIIIPTVFMTLYSIWVVLYIFEIVPYILIVFNFGIRWFMVLPGAYSAIGIVIFELLKRVKQRRKKF